MKFIDDIKKETLIICSNEIKKIILNMNKLIPVKFLTMKEFISKICFSYDENAIIYLMKQKNIKYEVAKMYLDNLCYVQDKKYNIKKLDYLVELKKELDLNNLLIYNNDFKEYSKNVDIIIYDIELSEFEKRILSGLNYKTISREYNKYNPQIISFKTMEEEIEYVAYKICELIDSGIDINNIKLANITKDYYNDIKRIFSLYNISINIPYSIKISAFDEVKYLINNIAAININEYINTLDKSTKVVKKMINVINNCIEYDDINLLRYKLENTSIKSDKLTNSVEIIDYLDYISNDDEYIFLMSFNDGIIPNSFKDIDYITDNIRDLVGIDNLITLNTKLREKIVNNLKDIKNLTITYKNSDNKKSYYPSTLCSEFSLSNDIISYPKSYSEKYNKIKLARNYDKYIKYGEKDKELDILNNNFKINYQSFSNKYTPISRKYEDITLSYSDMKVYNQCAFRYYLAKILKLDVFEENFSTVIGSMIHYVMEKCLSNDDKDYKKYVDEFLKDKEFTKKEQFFLNKYIDIIDELLEQVYLEKSYGKFDNALYEKKIEIKYEDNVKFKGFIDKILYYNDGVYTYYALIDYKTGNDQIDLKLFPYGFNLQLPIYLYLSKELEFTNPKCVGFYLQKINANDIDFRLVGYSNSDKETLSIIDNNYENSKIIKSMKTLKDGSFAKYCKILSDDEINDIIKITEEKIKEVIENIKNNKFDINPKVIDEKELGCEFCKFNDICNKTPLDKIYIKTESSDIDG